MRQRRLAVLLTVVLAATAGVAGSATAQNASDDPTVFPVTRGAGDVPDGKTFYQDLAVHPSEGRTMLVGVGVNDVVVHRNATLQAYDFDLRNYYFGADWHPSGDWALVASHDIPGSTVAGGGYRFGRGGGDLWRWEDGVFRRVYSGNVTLQSVAFAQDGAAIAVGTALTRPSPDGTTRVRNAVLYAPDGVTFRRLDVPTDAALRDVAWSPGGDRALIGGAEGTLLLFEDGDLADVSPEWQGFVNDIDWSDRGATLTGATRTDRFLPAGNGTVGRWQDGELRRVARVASPLRAAARRPGGDALIAVGADGPGGNGTAYRIDGGDATPLGLDAAPLRAVAWLDGENALLAGDREIWRYSTTVRPGDLPTRASLTVTPRTAAPGAPVRLDAWGSTNRGSADAIAAWQFNVPGTTTQWRASPRFETRFQTNGSRRVGVRVRADDGSVSPWLNRSVSVSPDHTHSAVTHRHGDGSVDGQGSRGVTDDDSPVPDHTHSAAPHQHGDATALHQHGNASGHGDGSERPAQDQSALPTAVVTAVFAGLAVALRGRD